MIEAIAGAIMVVAGGTFTLWKYYHSPRYKLRKARKRTEHELKLLRKTFKKKDEEELGGFFGRYNIGSRRDD